MAAKQLLHAVVLRNCISEERHYQSTVVRFTIPSASLLVKPRSTRRIRSRLYFVQLSTRSMKLQCISYVKLVEMLGSNLVCVLTAALQTQKRGNKTSSVLHTNVVPGRGKCSREKQACRPLRTRLAHRIRDHDLPLFTTTTPTVSVTVSTAFQPSGLD